MGIYLGANALGGGGGGGGLNNYAVFHVSDGSTTIPVTSGYNPTTGIYIPDDGSGTYIKTGKLIENTNYPNATVTQQTFFVNEFTGSFPSHNTSNARFYTQPVYDVANDTFYALGHTNGNAQRGASSPHNPAQYRLDEKLGSTTTRVGPADSDGNRTVDTIASNYRDSSNRYLLACTYDNYANRFLGITKNGNYWSLASSPSGDLSSFTPLGDFRSTNYSTVGNQQGAFIDVASDDGEISIWVNELNHVDNGGFSKYVIDTNGTNSTAVRTQLSTYSNSFLGVASFYSPDGTEQYLYNTMGTRTTQLGGVDVFASNWSTSGANSVPTSNLAFGPIVSGEQTVLAYSPTSISFYNTQTSINQIGEPTARTFAHGTTTSGLSGGLTQTVFYKIA